jgi:uncharacterized protein YndB with AHSA1/START domain
VTPLDSTAICEVPLRQMYHRWTKPELAMESTNPAVAVEIEAEIEIAAPVETVWNGLVNEIGQWWDHTFTDEPYGVFLEPTIGGRFYEQFDESGAGALHAHVTYIEPPKTLRISGPMGMPGARQYVKTYRLEALGDRTRVSTVASSVGDLSEELVESYRTGGDSLLATLKRHVEQRVAATA